MSKIKEILEYNFSEYEIACLNEAEIINGCGWKWGVDFDDIVQTLFKYSEWYDEKYFVELWKDFTFICNEHDIWFRLQLWFFKSNLKMCIKVYKLIKSWAGKKEAFIVASTIFALLQKYWKEFYKNANPLNIKK